MNSPFLPADTFFDENTPQLVSIYPLKTQKSQACLTRYRLPETTRWADALASNKGQAVAKANQILAR